MVNAIPETVTLESYVRGKTYEGIIEANKKVNQALCGAALSLGNNIEIVDIPGYSPLVNDKNMIELCREAAARSIPQYPFTESGAYSSGSTDMGDLSAIMPVVHPYAGGSEGKSHGNDYRIANVDAACVDNAKWQLCMLHMLLENNAERAYKVIEEYTPRFASKDEFLAFMDGLNMSGDRIAYNEDGTATVKL